MTGHGHTQLLASTRGTARLLRLSRSTPPGSRITDLAGSLDRNVMPGGPGYPGGQPQLADDGDTVVFCVRDRGCSHVYAAPADGSATAPSGRDRRGPRRVRALGRRAGRAAVALATPDSYGEIVVVDLGSGAETVITGHGASHRQPQC